MVISFCGFNMNADAYRIQRYAYEPSDDGGEYGDDEDDENDEDNWRNDYPDEEDSSDE